LAGGIKGITIKIGGDTTSLNKALSDVNKKTRDVQNELKKVDKALKLDPTNTELLVQKQDLLTQAVANTKQKLDALKQAQDKVNKAHEANADWEKQYEPLKKQIDETADRMKKLAKKEQEMKDQLESGEIDAGQYEEYRTELDKVTQEHKNLMKSRGELEDKFKNGHISDEEYRNYQRTLVETQEELKRLERKAAEANVTLSKISTISGDISGKAGKVQSAMSPVTKTFVGTATAVVAATEATKEYREDLAKLETNSYAAGGGLEATYQAYKDLNAITGESDSNVEALSNLLQAGFTDGNLADIVESLSGAVIKFPDTLKIESLSDSLQETLATGTTTGQFGELLDRLGIGADNFSEGLAGCASEADKQNFVMQTLANTGLSKLNDEYRQQNEALIANSDAQFDLNQAMADLGALIEPIVAKATQYIANLISWFTNLDPKMQKNYCCGCWYLSGD